MSGIKGMHHKTTRTNTLRRKVWQSMRIMRRFSIPDLCRTVPGAAYGNVRKFVSGLEKHGVIAKHGRYIGGRAGEYQIYRLVKDDGPEYPTVCPVCGQSMSVTRCDPSFLKKDQERKKETNKENSPPEPGGDL
ncbi:MAG: hypothetical protein SCI25_00045 [Desulfuromonadales bacterium]|nr:hypothetical protein [Desulfuromonadales bacterium]MDW7758711.1 hypothetical protein [Desulfuromonadales bacterium]